MSDSCQTIVLAGVGDLGRYVCEELLASPHFDVVVLSRGGGVSAKQDWLEDHHISVFTTNYTVPSILSILNSVNATTLVSFINISTPEYITVHAALVAACCQSRTCKRLIPSEWIGDLETYPLKPDFYATTRLPFREMLRAQDEVEWTLFNVGWLADYFLPQEKTYMASIKDTFPVDVDGWRACVRGSGDVVQSWTSARDVAKAVVELCRANKWKFHCDSYSADLMFEQEQVTYVAGEWNTFNGAIEIIESYYGRPLPLTYKSWDEIQQSLAAYAHDEDITALELAQIEEMMVMGYLACPKEKTMRQRERYFKNVAFRDLRTLLRCAETTVGVV